MFSQLCHPTSGLKCGTGVRSLRDHCPPRGSLMGHTSDTGFFHLPEQIQWGPTGSFRTSKSLWCCLISHIGIIVADRARMVRSMRIGEAAQLRPRWRHPPPQQSHDREEKITAMTSNLQKIPPALTSSVLDRGNRFQRRRPARLGLTGRLPSAVSTSEGQAQRQWDQLSSLPDDLATTKDDSNDHL